MSAIASFYVVRNERLTDLVAAATPATRRWFRSSPDTFPDVLRDVGRKLEAFGWSGWAFNTLDLYLEARHGLMYANFSDTAASRQLSKARGSEWLVLPAVSAGDLLAALNAVQGGAGEVGAFIAGERGPDPAGEEIEAVQAALAILKGWLAQVTPGLVGLLSVG